MIEEDNQIFSKKELRKNSPIRETLRLFLRNPTGMVAVFIIGAFIFLSIFGPDFATYPPDQLYPNSALMPPSAAHLFGTDLFGRDIFSRVMYAIRLDMDIAFLSTTVSYIIGVSLGIIAGYFGKITDNVVMRVMDVMFAFPYLLFAIAIAVVLGPSFLTIFIAITVVSIPTFARVGRSAVLSTKNDLYVTAAVALGAKKLHIMVKHILPSAVTPTIVLYALNLGAAVIVTASLSFLGLGIRPPTPELGAIITTGFTYIVSGQWWVSVLPGLFIVAIVVGFNMMGDAVREVTDVTLRR